MNDDDRIRSSAIKQGNTKATTRRNITFELTADAYDALHQDAALRGVTSLHQRGREIVIDYLNNQPTEEVAERLSSIELEAAGLRESITHLEKLLRRLAYVTIAVSQEHRDRTVEARQSDKANEWVKQNMPKQYGSQR